MTCGGPGCAPYKTENHGETRANEVKINVELQLGLPPSVCLLVGGELASLSLQVSCQVAPKSAIFYFYLDL